MIAPGPGRQSRLHARLFYRGRHPWCYPAENVANFSKIWSVVPKGEVFTAADLEKMKGEVAAAYAR
jgi:leucyl aminopeptidase (aminopeptidase T)